MPKKPPQKCFDPSCRDERADHMVGRGAARRWRDGRKCGREHFVDGISVGICKCQGWKDHV